MGCGASSQKSNKVLPISTDEFIEQGRRKSVTSRKLEALQSTDIHDDPNADASDAMESDPKHGLAAMKNVQDLTAELEACKQELSNALAAKLDAEQQLEGKVVIDTTAPVDEVLPVLQAELSRLQPYGATKSGPNSSVAEFNSTMDAQKTVISRLERDLAASKARTDELKAKYDKQKKRSRVSSAKIKAEAEIRVLEVQEKLDITTRLLKESNAALEEEKAKNSRLKLRDDSVEAIKGCNVESTNRNTDSDDDEDEARAGLILSLSSQIASLHEDLEVAKEEIRTLKSAA